MERNYSGLMAFLDGRHATPHSWGRGANDCVAFVLAAVEAQTGEVRAPDLEWSSRAEALKIIKHVGSLEAAFDLYFERIPPAQAQRGDIGAVPDDVFGVHPGIVEGDTIVGPGNKGNQRFPRCAMTAAWSASIPKAVG